jgi:hypothetical protein
MRFSSFGFWTGGILVMGRSESVWEGLCGCLTRSRVKMGYGEMEIGGLYECVGVHEPWS